MIGKTTFGSVLRASSAGGRPCQLRAVRFFFPPIGPTLTYHCQRYLQHTRSNLPSYASFSRSLRTTSRICTPPPSSPTQNIASASTAAGSQPIRSVDGATARRLVQEHQRRLYESRKMKSRNAAFYVAGAVSGNPTVKLCKYLMSDIIFSSY